MSVSVRVSDDLYEAAKRASKVEFRSIPQQIEFWARLGRAAELDRAASIYRTWLRP